MQNKQETSGRKSSPSHLECMMTNAGGFPEKEEMMVCGLAERVVASRENDQQ